MICFLFCDCGYYCVKRERKKTNEEILIKKKMIDLITA